MAREIDPHSISLRDLSYKARNLLSSLLKANKVLPTDGPDNLPRDWRGLASLINISAETATSLNPHHDRTGKILELWIQKGDGTATVGQLLLHLQKLDRYDVYDDLEELLQKGELLATSNSVSSQNQSAPSLGDERNDLITYQDSEHGTPQYYHAYVLFADEDRSFVDELLQRMAAYEYKLCTENDLLPGHATKYAPVSRLISERCHRIILIYSPEFLNSPANTFFMNYAQAVGIEMNRPKIIPCMYRNCQLPPNLNYYHKLYYTPPGEPSVYDFWEKLGKSLALVNLPRLTSGTASSTQSSVNITEVSQISSTQDTQTQLLALPSVRSAISLSSLSISGSLPSKLPIDDSQSLSNVNRVSAKKKKKSGTIQRILNGLKGKKKEKKALMVTN